MTSKCSLATQLPQSGNRSVANAMGKSMLRSKRSMKARVETTQTRDKGTADVATSCCLRQTSFLLHKSRKASLRVQCT